MRLALSVVLVVVVAWSAPVSATLVEGSSVLFTLQHLGGTSAGFRSIGDFIAVVGDSAPVPPGAPVGPATPFTADALYFVGGATFDLHEPPDPSFPMIDYTEGINDFLFGTRELIGGEPHYGWTRVKVLVTFDRDGSEVTDVDASLTELAQFHEPDANVPVIAGQVPEPSVGWLLLGSLVAVIAAPGAVKNPRRPGSIAGKAHVPGPVRAGRSCSAAVRA